MTDKPSDPADKVALDAAQDGQFQQVNRRAGYGADEAVKHRLFKIARRGGTLMAGEGKKIIDHYETAIRKALDFENNDPEDGGTAADILYDATLYGVEQ